MIEGTATAQMKAALCIKNGNATLGIMSHDEEVAFIKEKWGKTVPSDIGKCTLRVVHEYSNQLQPENNEIKKE